jgi:hypothetical protein
VAEAEADIRLGAKLVQVRPLAGIFGGVVRKLAS